MDLREILSMTPEEFIEHFNRCETVTEEFRNCRNLHEKLILLCMVLDTIAYTEDISHDELYEIIDDIKPVIGEVNEMMGKEGIAYENNNGDM